MNIHPLTLAFLGTVAARPGMFMRDFDLRALEQQLYGYEMALRDAEVMGEHEYFNFAFCEYLRGSQGLSCPKGWAVALTTTQSDSQQAFTIFYELVSKMTSGG
jgi:hypothetical protein